MRRFPLSLLPIVLVTACNSHGGSHDATSPADKAHNYAGIGAGEVLHFAGTEPFWGGRAAGTSLTYETPDNPGGAVIDVRRFAGNNGLSFSGRLGDRPFDMAVTEAPCSDGMSDRTYPFAVTLQIGAEARQGCGWTARRGFTGAAKP